MMRIILKCEHRVSYLFQLSLEEDAETTIDINVTVVSFWIASREVLFLFIQGCSKRRTFVCFTVEIHSSTINWKRRNRLHCMRVRVNIFIYTDRPREHGVRMSVMKPILQHFSRCLISFKHVIIEIKKTVKL